MRNLFFAIAQQVRNNTGAIIYTKLKVLQIPQLRKSFLQRSKIREEFNLALVLFLLSPQKSLKIHF